MREGARERERERESVCGGETEDEAETCRQTDCSRIVANAKATCEKPIHNAHVCKIQVGTESMSPLIWGYREAWFLLKN